MMTQLKKLEAENTRLKRMYADERLKVVSFRMHFQKSYKANSAQITCSTGR